MTPDQRTTVANYPQVLDDIKPEGEPDDQNRRCFVAEVKRDITRSGAYYETFVSNSDFNFFAMNRLAVAIDYDGKTPGTRNVWEAKDGYKHIPSNQF